MAFGGETAESYYDEGLTASMKGDLDAAMALFEKAIRLDNTMASAYHQMGKCYQRKGRPAEAVSLLRQVVSKKPQNSTARLDLGFALLAMGDIDEARRQFVQVSELDPASGKAQLGLAQAFFREGNWRGALDSAQTALANSGATFAVLFLLGKAAKLAGEPIISENNLKKADAILEKSLEIDPEKPESHYLRGEVAFVQENYPAALEHYSTAVKYAKPERTYSAYGESFTLVDAMAKRGLCLQRLGQTENARQVGQEIGKLDPDHKLGQSLREA